MKKIIFSLTVISVLIITSCQKNSDLANEANVSFIIETPKMATRAFGDGTMANDLYYGIYDKSGKLISGISKISESNKESINISKTINLRLVTDNTYSMIFWADNANNVCDVDFENMTMNFNPKIANQETYDAFWAYVEPFKVENDMTITIKLYRPFAQLNIGTNDIETASNAGMTISESKIIVKTPTSLNLKTGEVFDEQDVEYAYEVIPAGDNFPVINYEYLSMNYLLVGKDKSIVDVEFGYTDGVGDYNRKYTFVPVQRNYRTNIFGSLLTSSVDVNVVIEPTFKEPDYNQQY